MPTPRFVLVHGLITSSSMWRRQLVALNDAGAVAVAPDLPGHGVRTDDFTLDAAMAAIDDGIDALPGTGPVILVGLSLGGYLAMEYAGRWPDRIDGLVAMGCTTAPIAFGLGVYRSISDALLRQGELGLHTQRLAQTFVLGREGADDFLAGGVGLAAALDAINTVAELDPVASVRQIADAGVPIWFVNGQFDQMRLGERRFWEAAPQSLHTIVPLTPHVVNLANPGAINHLLTSIVHAVADEVSR